MYIFALIIEHACAPKRPLSVMKRIQICQVFDDIRASLQQFKMMSV